LDELFPLCLQLDTGVIVRVPFDEGSLAGIITPHTKFPSGDWRNLYFGGNRKRQVFDRIKRIETLLGEEAQSLAELALRFCLRPEAVSTVIPGMRSVEHVQQNARFTGKTALSEGLIDTLKQHRWSRNFYPRR
jgi:aryl-alcohol dehydrogenase-like predicted oxidoreductase